MFNKYHEQEALACRLSLTLDGYDEKVTQQSIQLIALDIDGTLTDPSYQVSARNIAALRAAHEAGIQIILATGRRHDYAMPIAKELGFPVGLISSNGALIRSSAGETFFTDRLPAKTALELIQYMDEFRGHAVLTFDRPDNVPGNDSLVLESADELNKTVATMDGAKPALYQVRFSAGRCADGRSATSHVLRAGGEDGGGPAPAQASSVSGQNHGDEDPV